MQFTDLPLPGLKLIEPRVFGDERGFFLESWHRDKFAEAGIANEFVQDNHSRSDRGVLRGMHFQNPEPQGKLVRVVRGAVWDVAVDLRRSSETFGQSYGVELSAANHRMLWVPEGFAHGFVALEDGTDFVYKCTGRYAPEHEHSLLWNDPALGIEWPLDAAELTISDKDRAGKPLSEIEAFA